MKTRGVEYLRKKLNGRSQARKEIVLKIQSSFSGIGWSKAESRTDMNSLWEKWLKIYNSLVEELIGTRWARVSSWERKFDSKLGNYVLMLQLHALGMVRLNVQEVT